MLSPANFSESKKKNYSLTNSHIKGEKMKALKVFITFALSVALLGGCATISNQTKQEVALTTSSGQSVVASVDGKKVSLPSKVNISRSSGTTVYVFAEDNPCYETTQLVIVGKNKVSGWFWGNIIFGGLFGSSTDALSGGMWSYTNPNFIVPVEKKPSCKAK